MTFVHQLADVFPVALSNSIGRLYGAFYFRNYMFRSTECFVVETVA
jgi:hypothetical protein